MTSMLTEMRGEEIPSDVDLNRLEGELREATTQVEHLNGSLYGVIEGEGEPPWITPEQAWHLHFYSEGFRMEGERLLDFAKEIKERSMSIYIEQLNR
jgi:hypothetical protein